MCTPHKSVYIIIPVHNRQDLTLACLENLKVNGDLHKYQALVVDDGSTDRTFEEVTASYPEVTILKGDGNLWWTGAITWGMQYAYAQGAEYFIWLNDDTHTEPNTLNLLIDFLTQHPHSIVGASCYASESNQLVETGFKGRYRLKASPDQIVEVDGLSGYCVGISARIFTQIGAPDPVRFRHYGGDGMYTLKATRAGFKVYLLGKAKATLIAETDPVHNFSNYLNQSIKQSKKPTLNLVFGSYKSPYHLITQFHIHTYKYGILIGIPLFIAKAISWLVRFYV
ncbi:MAG: glycosyltransferase family 2 protein [Pseudanabaenaceae cyanobacterium bins.68]|nr:glycosyltransferase family 2 protein [Pseudanabaenaceae cyanobacterium bins.68]